MGGGSGGVFGGDYTPSRYKEIIREAREQTRDVHFETTVNGKIAELLTDYHRHEEATGKKLDEIKEIIEEDIGGTVELRFGGSVSKHTYVDGLSDVDVLVLINNSELADASPQEALEYLKMKLERANLQSIDDIRVGALAVTVKFSDGEKIQLLPAVRKYSGYRIADPSGTMWSNVIRPDMFAKKLTHVNQNCGGKVVPTIKLAKDIVSQLPEDQRLKGYHIESIAIEVFKSYQGPYTNKVALRYFFENAKDVVRKKIIDKTNQSVHVDDYLGPDHSIKRMRISYALDRIGRRMKNADEVGSVDEWNSIVEV